MLDLYVLGQSVNFPELFWVLPQFASKDYVDIVDAINDGAIPVGKIPEIDTRMMDNYWASGMQPQPYQ